MYKHPKSRRIKSSNARGTKETAQRKLPLGRDVKLRQAPSDDGGGFLTLLLERIGWDELNKLNQRKHRAGRPVRLLNRGQLLVGLIFHCTVSLAGSFGEHLF